jgi:flagellar biogenesis protein FliO
MKTSRSKRSHPAPPQVPPFPVIADTASLNTIRASAGFFARVWAWVLGRYSARSNNKRLRVAETVSLGERRFVAVVQVDGRHFLLAGSPTNIVLLAQLDDKEPFEKVLKKTMTLPRKRPPKRAKKVVSAKGARPAPPTNVLDQAIVAPDMPMAREIRKSTDKPSMRQTGNA